MYNNCSDSMSEFSLLQNDNQILNSLTDVQYAQLFNKFLDMQLTSYYRTRSKHNLVKSTLMERMIDANNEEEEVM